MRGTLAGALMLAVLGACADKPPYDVRVRLPATDGGQAVDQDFNNGTASLRYFSCSVSVRLGQCIRSRPIQAVIVPAAVGESGSATCPGGSAKKILNDHLNQAVPLGKGADGGAGLVWIQMFNGDDDDDSNVVNPYEMAAYAELTNGTITVTRLDDHLVADVAGTDFTGAGELKGTLAALDSENSVAVGVGPVCTWPIGAKTE